MHARLYTFLEGRNTPHTPTPGAARFALSDILVCSISSSAAPPSDLPVMTRHDVRGEAEGEVSTKLLA